LTALLINIDVDDLERGIAFYRDALGLKLNRRLFGNVAEMVGAACPIYLLEKPAGSRAAQQSAQQRDYARHWTPLHLDFAVPDIDAAIATALGAGARLECEIQQHKWGKLATLSDPFGHGFCFIQFLGRGYDEVA
jgi:catechol 2,3-dioxygenase-like lactoylglutathione lyase family enzyme